MEIISIWWREKGRLQSNFTQIDKNAYIWVVCKCGKRFLFSYKFLSSIAPASYIYTNMIDLPIHNCIFNSLFGKYFCPRNLTTLCA